MDLTSRPSARAIEDQLEFGLNLKFLYHHDRLTSSPIDSESLYCQAIAGMAEIAPRRGNSDDRFRVRNNNWPKFLSSRRRPAGLHPSLEVKSSVIIIESEL